MLGLKTQESDKFNRFWNLVQQSAAKMGAVFFCENGEGRDFETEDMEGEDTFGWLIPEAKVKEFQPEWEAGNVGGQWSPFCRFALWREEAGTISIVFQEW